MKKRSLFVWLLILILSLCTFGLTACGGDNSNSGNSDGDYNIAVTSISLNRSSVSLEIGDTVSIYETIYPNNATDKSVTWSSSNATVATVSNGTITAKSAGTATITVETSNNKTATCYVTVNNLATQTVAVDSISLSQTSVILTVDDTLNLIATVSPNNATDKSVTWSSSNTTVATVSNGTITAKSAGTATITVETSNNKIATCTITVENPETNFQLIYDTIKENDNYLVIGSLMNKDIYLSTLNDEIVVSVSASESTRYGVNPHEHNDTSVDFNVSIDKNGYGVGSCILIYKEVRVINHATQTTTYKKSTAVFDVRITNIGDAVEYRDYQIYYDNQNSYTQSLSGAISYYDAYLSLCKEHYTEGIVQLALESFYSIINE